MALVHKCRQFVMKANVVFVAAMRRISLRTTAYFIIVTAALCACAVPAIPQCVRPHAENAYNYSKVNEINLRLNGFKVTGIQCANGYEMDRKLVGHTSPIASKCRADGDPYQVYGCLKTPNSSWICASLNVIDLDNDAYDVSNAVETNLAADALNVTGVICSKGYKGTVKVSPCSWQVETKRVCETKLTYVTNRYGVGQFVNKNVCTNVKLPKKLILSGCSKVKACLSKDGAQDAYFSRSANLCDRPVTSKEECETAAQALGLPDQTAEPYNSLYKPAGCFFYGHELRFNAVQSTMHCGSNSKCLCKKKENFYSSLGYDTTTLVENDLDMDDFDVCTNKTNRISFFILLPK
jgi:hypothetical protein